MQALAFQSTKFDIVDRSGQPWLRGYQIGTALEYTNQPDAAIRKIYDRNADEFTDRMTAVVELETAGGKQQVRIFSLRGAHLLGMLSRTKKAKEFRAWVLDVLEGIAEPKMPQRKTQPKALPNGLSIDQQDAIKAMIKARVESLPQEKRAKGAITCWSALKSKFGCTYKQIPAEHFTDAASLVARVPLEGEWLGKESVKPERLNIHYPVTFLTDQHPGILKPYSDSHDWLDVTLEQLDERSDSAVESILHELHNAGYNIDAAWFEIRTYRNKFFHLKRALSGFHYALESPQDFLVNKA